MHAEARDFIAAHAVKGRVTVLECGSRDINGSVRHLFPNAKWVGVDITGGNGVDVVADFATYRHPRPVGIVVCCEVLEHTEGWPSLIESAAANLKAKGTFLLTAAGPGRSPHSATDGGQLQPGEWYRNIEPDELDSELGRHFSSHEIDILGPDIRAVATK